MKAPVLRITVVCCALLCAASVARAQLWPAKERQPYVVRIHPVDYLKVEALLPEQLSLKSELVMIRTDEGKPSSAVAITRDTESNYFAVYLAVFENSATDSESDPKRFRAKLDPELARAVEKIFTQKLSHFVMVAPKPMKLEDTSSTAWWIFLRGPNDVAITAIVDRWTVHRVYEGFEFIWQMTGGLEGIATSEPKNRNSVVERLRNFCDETLINEAAQRW